MVKWNDKKNKKLKKKNIYNLFCCCCCEVEKKNDIIEKVVCLNLLLFSYYIKTNTILTSLNALYVCSKLSFFFFFFFSFFFNVNFFHSLEVYVFVQRDLCVC